MGPLWFPLHLLLLTQVSPSHTRQSLRCLNDYVNNITCIWDSQGVPPETVCTLHGVHGMLRKLRRTCELKPLNRQNPALRGCHIVFEKRKFGLRNPIPMHVKCENETNPVMEDYAPHLHIKMSPPGTPNVTNYTISWSSGRPASDVLQAYTFQLQYKQEEHDWENAELVNILDKKTQLELNEGALERGKSYQVRVRVGVPPEDEGYKGEWSHWSPITSWRSEVGREPPKAVADTGKEKERLLIGFGAALLVVLTAVSITLPIRYIWVHVASNKMVPNPSKYFDVLNSIHGGNFQKWLSPVYSTQSFDILQYSDHICHVEVYSKKDTDTLHGKGNATVSVEQDISGQSPSFSNLSYFYSSDVYEVEKLLVCSGQPAGGAPMEREDGEGVTDTGSIQMDSSYKCLQKLIDRQEEPMHPDSGIGVGPEDQDTEDEGDDEAEDVGNDMRKETAVCSDPSAFLPFLLPFGKSPFGDNFPQHLSAFPHLLFPLPNKGTGGLVEPCSDGYQPVKEIQNRSSGGSSEDNMSM